MKAAVLHNFGESPRYEEFPDPIPGKDEALVRVKAIAFENVDQMISKGTHFASKQFIPEFPSIVGIKGVGELPGGELVAFGDVRSPYGAMAEKTVVLNKNIVPLPKEAEPTIATALPPSALTSLLPLKWGVNMNPGETVLINGATGVSGKLSIQVARLLGAGRVIGTGRNEESLKRIKELGADAVIDLKQSEEKLIDAFAKEVDTGIDVILDFLWGYPTEVLIKSLVPRELSFRGQTIHLVQIGEKGGSTLNLSADALRTSGLKIIGSSTGVTSQAIKEGSSQIWKWIKENKLRMDLEIISLQDIEKVWERSDFQGKRLVIVP